MIFSNDLSVLLLGMPKTGTHSAREALKDHALVVAEAGKHPIAFDSVLLAREKGYFPEYPIAKVYAIWRDPVERFKSAFAHMKKTNPDFFFKKFPEKFVGIDFVKGQPVSNEFIQAINSITTTEIFPYVLIERIELFKPQKFWLKDHVVTCLPFSDYDNSMRIIFNEMGVDNTIPIPKLNVSDGTYDVTLTAEEEQNIRNFYRDDYYYQS